MGGRKIVLVASNIAQGGSNIGRGASKSAFELGGSKIARGASKLGGSMIALGGSDMVGKSCLIKMGNDDEPAAAGQKGVLWDAMSGFKGQTSF